MHAFDHARAHRDAYRRLKMQRDDESEKWQQALKETKERHRLELRRLHGDPAAMQSDRQDQFSYYGEKVIDDLLALQQHLRGVRERTVDTVVLDGEDFVEATEAEGLGDPAEGAEVFAATGAFDAEVEVNETEIAGDMVGGVVEASADGPIDQPDDAPAPPDIPGGQE